MPRWATRSVAWSETRSAWRAFPAAEGVDALVLVTEWKQFRQANFERIRGLMRMPVIFDGRNLYEPAQLVEAGFLYRGIGRPASGHCKASAA
nr:UDP binding domain-containing protein [Pseudomonas sp. DY-1]